MTADRHKMFQQLKELIKSSESNYQHGRSYQGQKRLIEAHSIITEFLGDNLDPDKYEIFVKHIQTHLNEWDSVICTICGRSVEEIAHAELGDNL